MTQFLVTPRRKSKARAWDGPWPGRIGMGLCLDIFVEESAV